MLATIAVILVILWGIGLIAHIAGAFIHVALVVAIILFAMHFMRRSRSKTA